MSRNRSAGQGLETLASVAKARAPPRSPGWTRRVAYCLQVTLKQRLSLHAPGLTPTAVLEKKGITALLSKTPVIVWQQETRLRSTRTSVASFMRGDNTLFEKLLKGAIEPIDRDRFPHRVQGADPSRRA